MNIANLNFILVALVHVSCGSASNEEHRRLVLHSDVDVLKVLDDLKQEINATKQKNLVLETQMAQMKAQTEQDIISLKTNMTLENQALKTNMTQENQALKTQSEQEILALRTEISQLRKGKGSSYVRWGRTVCPGNGTEKVYSGYTAGSDYSKEGGPASYLCLPETPSWAKYVDGIQLFGQVFGAEYQTHYNHFDQTAFGKNMQEEDPPCVVCHCPRTATIMIPGSTSCYPGWTHEYDGYLMTGDYQHTSATDYICLDKQPEAVFHGEANTDGKLLYFTEVHCGGLPCQVYPNGRELACVVCSK